MYCPKCDKRLAPDHRCTSRRFFLGALLGAIGASVLEVEAKKAGLVIDNIDWKTKTVTFKLAYIPIQVSEKVPKNEIWMLKGDLLYSGMVVEVPPPGTY